MSSFEKNFNQTWSIIHLLPYSHNVMLTSRKQKNNELQLIRKVVEKDNFSLDNDFYI